jgi:hypothetical protein
VAGPRASLPLRWFRDPLDAALKKVIRPATALTRRKEIVLKMKMPRDVFEDFMSPLTENDAEGLEREPATNRLQPTRVTGTLNHFKYTIKKGSVSDRLFQLDALDPPLPAKPAPKRKAAEMAEIGEEGVYEVEQIVAKRQKGKRTQYQIKWRGWASEANTWEYPSNIDKGMINTYEGKAPPKQRSSAPLAPLLPKRGAGCARARLSAAEQRRGAVPQMMSMVCGNVMVHLTEATDESKMPSLTLTLFVLTMDKNGHITWPTNFTPATQAALRKQARTLLQKMIDDPLNPVDATMAPALEGMGTSSLWKGAPRRQLVQVATD